MSAPPKPAKLLLKILSSMEKDEGYLGDVEEMFQDRFDLQGRWRSGRWYWGEVFLAFPKFMKESIRWRTAMLKNYLKIAFRNLVRSKGYSAINITGLAVGLACFVLMLLYVQFELSFDNFHENGDQIYRFYKKRQVEGTAYLGNPYLTTTPAPLAPTLKAEYPEIVNGTRVCGLDALLIHQENKFYERGFWADEQFLKIFSFPLRRGNLDMVLVEPDSMVVTQKLADKLFGSSDPVGEVITLTYGLREINFHVTGVLENNPANSHLRFDFLVSYINLKDLRHQGLEGWYNNSDTTYIQLQEGHDYKELENKLPAFLDKYAPKRYADYVGYLQPLKRIHLHSFFNFDNAVTNDINNIYLFSAIALIILIIACINYMNLSTARSFQRAKEVGMRKVVGAGRRQIIRQLLGEAVFLTGLALLGALVLVKLALPVFNSFTRQNLELNVLKNPGISLALFTIMLLVGLISGSYPAVFLSGFRPIKVLKGEAFGSRKGSLMRSILVIFQFSTSIILIVCTLVISSQLKFIKDKDLGFKRDHVVTFRIREDAIRNNIDSIKNTLAGHPNFLKISISGYLPIEIADRTDVTVINQAEQEVEVSVYHTSIDYNYLDVFDIELLQGRNFSPEFPTDKEQGVILNETAVNLLGWKEPIGKRMEFNGGDYVVVGVVKDFHYQTLHRPIEPMAFHTKDDWFSWFAARIKPENIPQTIAFLKETYEQYNPLHPFEFDFLDDSFNRIYRAEQKFGSLFRIFSFLAIFVACLGLYGLASFTVERKTREIGIRKILGASTPGVLLLFTREFIRWVAAANLVAWPVAYFAMDHWLSNFAYRTSISWTAFVMAGAAALLIALLTVAYQSLRAAAANPADSLRYE